MSKENKNETVVRANFNSCQSISVTLRENNMIVMRNSQIVYDGIYDSEVLQQILIESEITSSSETTDSIVSFLDDLSNPSEQAGYLGCLGFCFLILSIVALVGYGLWHLIGLF